VIDPRHKVGAELDLIFKHQHDISNTTRCAEGVSPDDEYRIVQTRAEGFWAASRHQFDASLGDGSSSSSGSTCTGCSGVNHGPIHTGESKDTTLEPGAARSTPGVHHSGR
jgi:hypothetical protein